MSRDEFKPLLKKVFSTQQLNSLPPVPVAAYILITAMDLPFWDAIRALVALLPVNMLLVGIAGPYFIVRSAMEHAFINVPPQERPELRLARILKVPRIIEFRLFVIYVCSGFLVIGAPSLYYHRSLARTPFGVAGYVLVVLLMFIRQNIQIQDILRPHALAIFHRHPDVKPTGKGFYWPRQSWYLPYAFALFVLCAIWDMGLIIARKYEDGVADLMNELAKMPEVAQLVQTKLTAIGVSLILPLTLVGGFILVVAAISAWLLAQNQHHGSQAVQGSIESLASGKPTLPKWVATDELGDLAVATAAVFRQLRNFSASLRESASQLGVSASDLGHTSNKQNEVLTLQASALQETQVTAQEIKQTSTLAAQKADSVLVQTQRADEISRASEEAITASLKSLEEIGTEVKEMEVRIQSLGQRTHQIGNITSTVKDLADQSNMLALNAAIEAVRAGEHGKGFGVVAREIRALADQSIQATRHVREILEEITQAIGDTVSITERGAHKVGKSVEQVRAFGENVREMAGIVRENANSVRQISAAINQQNTGIHQIFQAVTELSRMMDEAMGRLRITDQSTSLVRGVADKVSDFVGKFAWDAPELAQSEHPRAELPPPSQASKAA